MPDFDAKAAAATEKTAVAPARFIWLDFAGDPLRVTTYDRNVTFAGTGDPDLDGHTFLAFDGRIIEVSDISNSESGSDTLTISVSGLPSIDSELLEQIADRSLWQGRIGRIWDLMHDETGTEPQGAIVPYYTGYMSRTPIKPGKTSQTASLELENYIAVFNDASNRTYLDQKEFDPDDDSAQATLAAANMARGAPGGGGGATGNGREGGSGGFVINSVRPM